MASPPHPLARRAFLIRRSLKRKAPLRFSALVGGVVESAPSSSQRAPSRISARLRKSIHFIRQHLLTRQQASWRLF